MQTKHRGEATTGEAMVARLQSIILEGAKLIAFEGDESLYSTPSDRFFMVNGDGLRPVTADEARRFVDSIFQRLGGCA